jgi:hypothetical protein
MNEYLIKNARSKLMCAQILQAHGEERASQILIGVAMELLLKELVDEDFLYQLRKVFPHQSE